MINHLSLVLLCVFWLLFLGRTAILTCQGVKVFVIGQGQKTLRRALEFLLLPFLILWSGAVLQIALSGAPSGGFSLWEHHALRWVGVLLCTLGLLLFLAALVSFGRAWRVGIDDKNSTQLVTRGIFSLSRNPIFLFMDLFFFGMFLIYPTWFFLAFSLCEILAVHLQILSEEKFLRERFGQEYGAYCSRVRRYL